MTSEPTHSYLYRYSSLVLFFTILIDLINFQHIMTSPNFKGVHEDPATEGKKRSHHSTFNAPSVGKAEPMCVPCPSRCLFFFSFR
jgi:hypothetical protein